MTVLEQANKVAKESLIFAFVTKVEVNEFGEESFLVKSEIPLGPDKEKEIEILPNQLGELYLHFISTSRVIPMTLNNFKQIAA